jgi:hypothetical protein
MQEASPGDIVVSFARSHVQAIGVVKRNASMTPKPDFNGVGENWGNVGWFLEVEFQLLAEPFRPREFKDLILPHLPSKYSPLNRNSGDGLQGVYLTEINPALAAAISLIANCDLDNLRRELSDPRDDGDAEIIEREIESRQIEGDLEKVQLVKARRGQGIFKANVRLFESECRVTHVKSIKHLRASHIKPWAESDDKEKIDGANGLLLAPHIDHLFDRGFITFSGGGELITSPNLDVEILNNWAIELPKKVGSFSPKQTEFLEYHRELILQR